MTQSGSVSVRSILSNFFLFCFLPATFSSVAMAMTGSSSIKVALPTVDSSWEHLSSDAGITVHRKEIAGSPVVAFRGETIIDAPIAKVANVLMDTSRKLEWVAKIVEAKNIRELGDFERIEYNHTSSGVFIVRDRDFVFHASVDFDVPNRRAIFRMKSVEDPLMPETRSVRGQLNQSAYTLTSLPGDQQTHIVVEIHADPKGSVPKWIVNLFQKSWPSKTLSGIREQCARPDVQEHPKIKAMFTSKAMAAAS